MKSAAGEKLLGVHINENLKWDDHVNKVKKKISTNLWLLSRIKIYIPFNTRILFYKAYIQPHLDFCNIVWGGTKSTNLYKLFRLQKKACKTIFGMDYTSVSHAMEIMNSLNIHDRIILQKAKVMYKVSKGLVPGYISDLFYKDNKIYTNLRTSSKTNYTTPRPRLEQFKESISYSGPSIWNKIPESIRSMNTVDSFTTHFIRWLKSQRQDLNP